MDAEGHPATVHVQAAEHGISRPSTVGRRTMSNKQKLEELTPWAIERYELHEDYSHGEPPAIEARPAISVAQYARGPNAIVLERALFLNGYTKLLVTPEDDPGLHAPQSEDGQSWLDIPQVRMTDTRIVLGDGSRADGPEQWPATPERIEIDVTWTLNGATRQETLRTDLAFGRT